MISKWTVPDKYYVSFPYGVYDAAQLQQHRSDISGKKKFYLSHAGKTVRDGEYLSFTFDAEDWKIFRKIMLLVTVFIKLQQRASKKREKIKTLLMV